MVEFMPRTNHMLVKPHEDATMTAGGIILPEIAERRNHYGKVIKVGPLVADLQPNDNVVWGKHDGTEIDVMGEKAYIIKDTSVITKFAMLPDAGYVSN